MKARVHIMLKTGVLDPQGEAVRHALGTLGFEGVTGVRQGKVIELELASNDAAAAEIEVAKMCEALLANTVIERYSVEILCCAQLSYGSITRLFRWKMCRILTVLKTALF